MKMTGRTRQPKQCGAVLLLALLVLFLSSIAGQAVYSVHVTQLRREKEQQLLFAGDQYRRAIRSYYNSLPVGGTRKLPASLEELLADTRFPTPIHHLRRLYPDPITGNVDWELVQGVGGIRGVRSTSMEQPVGTMRDCEKCVRSGAATTYREWIFEINPS